MLCLQKEQEQDRAYEFCAHEHFLMLRLVWLARYIYYTHPYCKHLSLLYAMLRRPMLTKSFASGRRHQKC